jgi:hypothetical protein
MRHYPFVARGRRRRRRKDVADPFAARKQLTPRLVGSLGEQVEDIDSRVAQAMFVVVDPDEVPGLREVLERQKAGHSFDVITRCGGGLPADASASPVALINIAIPETDLAIEIALGVDEYRHSLLEAVRSQQVMLLDTDTSIALQSMPSERAFAQGLSMGVPLTDTTPIMGLLQQRVDLPLPSYKPSSIRLTDENRGEAVDHFIRGAVVPRMVAVQYREAHTPSIVIVDGSRPERVSDDPDIAPLDGRWSAMSGGGGAKSVVRLDVFHEGKGFGSWIIPSPDPRLIRAGASGSHHVMLLAEPLADDQVEAEKQWAGGISVWVLHVEALRALLIGLD